jgi:myo-inositol-1(or 4)-monophosphatase
MDNLDKYLAEAEAAILKLLKEWQPKLAEHFGEDNYSLKSDMTVVTEMDRSLELAIKDALRPLNANVGFVGEEHGQEGSEDMFWLVDPIDGTELYIRGVDGCRTLLCLIMNGEPVYAFAYRFMKDELFTAKKGKGTTKNGVPVQIKSRELNRLWVEMSLDMSKPELMAKIVRLASAVNATLYTKDFLRVLDGHADAHVVAGLGGMWDYAPRALLMKEAGAQIGNIGSKEYDYKNLTLVAVAPNNFEAIQKLLSDQA